MLPPEIGNLVDLEYLNMSETSIKSLPPEIAFCEKLQELNMYGNILEMLPETMRELHELTELKINARSFHSNLDDYMNKLLRNGNIKSQHIPSVLFDIPELRTLDLDGTRINSLPEKNSCKLEELYLSNNYFLSVPKGLQTLPYLVMVDMSHNFLPAIPDNIQEFLPSIRILRLNYNLLTSLPHGLCNLITLEELELSNNKQLPQGIGNLTQLRVLRAANNRIYSLPNSLCDLLDLETLELTNNRLAELPVTMFNLTKLTHMHTFSHMKPVGLWLHKNPITEPPEIKRTEHLQPVKLILLGQQGCGKTTLNRTISSAAKCPTSSDNTQKASLHNYLSAEEKSNLMKRLPRDELIENIEEPNSYDLGGADMYKVLHQHMLDKEALTLLVYDHSQFSQQPETYHSQIGYWIDLLHLHVPGAVVKLVGTHRDLLTPESVDSSQVQESVKRQIDEYRAYLATELSKLKEKIEKVKAKSEANVQRPSSNLTEFDPMANILQLEYQAKQMKNLLDNPLKIMPKIALVSCTEGVEGVLELISDMEMIAINKELMPTGQRYIPMSWQKLKGAIKKRPGYKLNWAQVKDLGVKYKIQGEILTDALEYAHNCGDVLWLQNHHKLKEVVFHKPFKLIEALRGIIHHDISNILDFDGNKSFSSIGKLSKEQFEECRNRMLTHGEISRQLLLGLWYYLPFSTDREQLAVTYELIKDFELAYLIPQSDLPTSKTYCEPLMVVPWYVSIDSTPSDIEIYWDRAAEDGMREMEIVYTFPHTFPEGIFERMSTQLQQDADIRLDWANTIYIEAKDKKTLVRRFVNQTSSEINVQIQVRNSELRGAVQHLAQLHQIWINILGSVPGIIWKILHYTAKKLHADKLYSANTPLSATPSARYSSTATSQMSNI
ncbi:hypothetical protein EB796_016722 [Bugula neritina]|uniref:MFHAS1 n=1 Tax=Bugula neritina TaxID=10212 RepID=A0A7J7JG21_BUGNE|nr:hypothetical protein EB796_016722 [Bugula neritina]